MLEAMVKGKHVGRLDLHVVGDSLAFIDRGERARDRDHPGRSPPPAHRVRPAPGRDRSGDDARTTTSSGARRSRRRSRARPRCWSRCPRRSPAAGSRTASSRWTPPRPISRASRSSSTRTTRRAQARAAAGKPVGLGNEGAPAEATRPPRRPPRAARYIGTATCGGCHAPALAYWKTTKHARALSALARIGRDKRPVAASAATSPATCNPAGPPTSPTPASASPMWGAKRATARGASMARPSTSAARWRAPSRGDLPRVPHRRRHRRRLRLPEVRAGDRRPRTRLIAALAPGPARPL